MRQLNVPIEENLYREFKASVALRGTTISQAIKEAIELWLSKEESK
ncbi:MAG: plasmid partition protein ParG [Candidatus Heimdallarchaeaceae archaeon]